MLGRPRIVAAWIACSLLTMVVRQVDAADGKATLNIAHRGGAVQAPENTMRAFRTALKNGADALEIDIQTTRGGVPVCLHDVTVDRTTDGTGSVYTMSLRELQDLDAGYRYTMDAGLTFPFRDRGIRIPSLRQIVRQFPDTLLVLDIKGGNPAVAASVLRVVKRHGRLDKIVLFSLHDAVVREARRLEPSVPTALGFQEERSFAAMSSTELARWKPPAGIVLAQAQHVTSGYVARARVAGLTLFTYTVNDVLEMLRLSSLGVDGIITDDPVALRSLPGH